MKIFSMDDTDSGRASIVVADDLEKAIQLYKKAFRSYPERLRELTADEECVIIQGMMEPVY